jgi:hypothetical protein
MVIETLAAATHHIDILATSGDTIANKLQTFIAPIAAIVIGAVGLKYLFGENKSLAAFLGFVFLGACVYALIMWGDTILNSLGGVVNGILT